jgi:hypothetical protein
MENEFFYPENLLTRLRVNGWKISDKAKNSTTFRKVNSLGTIFYLRHYVGGRCKIFRGRF